jgi:hypothetical protein
MQLSDDVCTDRLLPHCFLICQLVNGACCLVSNIIGRYMPPQVDIKVDSKHTRFRHVSLGLKMAGVV